MKKVLLCAMAMGVLLANMPAEAVDMTKLPIVLDASAGFDFDSNVNLRSSSNPPRGLQPDGNAGLYKQQATLGYNLGITGDLSLLAQYSYYQDFHFRLSPYDNLSHNLTLSPTYKFFGGSGQLVGLFNFNYLDIGSDKYKTAYSVMPTYYQMLNRRLMLEMGASFERAYYFAPITIQQDDRSAHTYGANLGMFFFFNNDRTAYLQLRYSPLWNVTAGSNFNGATHTFLLAAQIPATKQLTIKPYISYSYQPYFNTWINAADPTLNIYPKRTDNLVTGGIQATYKIYKGFYTEAHYNFTIDASNINFYTYNRHVVGGTIGYRY
jgi:hypothetical protein